MENFEVQNLNIKLTLKKLGIILRNAMPKGWGFTLFIFDYGKGGSMFYISASKREDMIKSLEEFIAKQKQEGK